jgi:Dockerin type I domain
MVLIGHIGDHYQLHVNKIGMYKNLLLILLLSFIFGSLPSAAVAAMRINGITLPDISTIATQQIGDLSYILEDTDDYKIFFTSLDSSFTIRLYESTEDVALRGEQRILQLLKIAPFEACWLPIHVYVAGAEGLPKRPRFCNQEQRTDVNLDGGVNSLDLTTCMKQKEAPPSPAVCDIDHDTQVSALDISLILTFLGNERK